MGFQVRRRQYKLVWPEDDPLHGLEITVGGMNLGEFNDLRKKVDGEPDAFDRKSIETYEFLSRVIDWNLEDEDGNPLTVGESAFNELGPVETSSILRTWLTVALGGQVEPPLPRRSSDGATSAKLEQLPMETL